MSRWTTFALSTVSVLALTAVTAPATAEGQDGGSTPAAARSDSPAKKMRDGQWCC